MAGGSDCMPWSPSSCDRAAWSQARCPLTDRPITGLQTGVLSATPIKSPRHRHVTVLIAHSTNNLWRRREASIDHASPPHAIQVFPHFYASQADEVGAF